MRCLGFPKEPIQSMFLALQKAAHRIRTAFGVSDKKYGDDLKEPLQGLGQGNGCGPAGWAIVSTPIINMMRALGFGATFFTAMSVQLITFVCYAFVDDTDVVHTAQDVNTTGQDILIQMQQVIDHWEGGLRATGGAIVPKKSYWYLIDWIWEKGKWKYASIDDIPGDLTIRDTCGTKRVTLQRYNPEIAKETLGVFLAMDGNNREEILKLRAKTQEFADQIRTGSINKVGRMECHKCHDNDDTSVSNDGHYHYRERVGLYNEADSRIRTPKSSNIKQIPQQSFVRPQNIPRPRYHASIL